MQRGLRKQGGNTLLIVAVILVLGLAAAIYKNESRKASKQEQVQREATQKATLIQADQERLSLQKAADAAKAKDLLASALKAADDVLVRWEDASAVATNTARMSLSGPVSNLQTIKREAGNLVVPPCLANGKAELLKGMELYVDGYLEFMANTAKLGGVIAASKFEEAKPHFDNYRNDRKACPMP